MSTIKKAIMPSAVRATRVRRPPGTAAAPSLVEPGKNERKFPPRRSRSFVLPRKLGTKPCGMAPSLLARPGRTACCVFVRLCLGCVDDEKNNDTAAGRGLGYRKVAGGLGDSRLRYNRNLIQARAPPKSLSGDARPRVCRL
jgi:hypothetical protein